MREVREALEKLFKDASPEEIEQMLPDPTLLEEFCRLAEERGLDPNEALRQIVAQLSKP
jgi:hypothetical protein